MKNDILVPAVMVVSTFLLSPVLLAQSSRTADGKPDFSGLWGSTTGINAAVTPSVYQGGDAPRQPTRAERASELPLTPWGQEQVAYVTAADGAYGGESGAPEDPRFHRLCGAPYSPSDLPGSIEIVQNPHRLLLVYTRSHPWIRQVWLGREHPEDPTDYNPKWMGHSVAEWDGDTLVVETIGISEGTFIDHGRAAPHSGQLRMIERVQLLDDGTTLRIDRTFEDPMAYTRPWSDTKVYALQTDWDQIVGDWEIAETHTVCEGGTYPTEHDPWFDNFDTIKEEILPNLEILEQGSPSR